MKTNPTLVGIGIVAMVLTGMAMLIRRAREHFAPTPQTAARDSASISRLENEGGHHPIPKESLS